MIERWVPAISSFAGDIDFVVVLVFWIVIAFWFILLVGLAMAAMLQNDDSGPSPGRGSDSSTTTSIRVVPRYQLPQTRPSGTPSRESSK